MSFFTGGRGRWPRPMACVDTGPGWTAAGDGRAAPGVTASVSAIMPAAAAAGANRANKVVRFQAGVKHAIRQRSAAVDGGSGETHTHAKRCHNKHLVEPHTHLWVKIDGNGCLDQRPARHLHSHRRGALMRGRPQLQVDTFKGGWEIDYRSPLGTNKQADAARSRKTRDTIHGDIRCTHLCTQLRGFRGCVRSLRQSRNDCVKY